MIHWQVKFKSLRADELYTVNIYDDNYYGQPIQLTGAAQPFVTQEDNSDDPFLPVRTHSGYIRIVDTGEDGSGNAFNWRDLIPATDTDRPVTLTDSNGNTLWMGCIQPRNFGASLYGNPQELGFPIMCSVSLTNGVDVDIEQTGLQNFAYLLEQAILSIPSPVRPTDFVFQGKDIADELLLKLIDWQNFLNENEDGDAEARCTMYECLEHMCRFWGWTLRTCGSTWYFMCPDDTQVMGGVCIFDLSTLSVLSGGSGFWQIDQQSNTFIQLVIGDVFADVANTDSQLRGPAKVFVNANPNPADEFVVDPFDSLLEEAMEEAGWQWGVQYNNTLLGITNDILSVDRKGFSFTAQSGLASFNMVQKSEDGWTYDGEVINVLAIKVSGSSSGPVLASLETKYMHSFADGFFMLHGTTYRGADEYEETDAGIMYAGNREMFMAFGVGTSRYNAMWWNGATWQASYTRFTVTIGNRKPDYFSRYWQSGLSALHTNIMVTEDLYGYLYADFFGSYAGTYGDRSFPETDGEKSFNLRDFKIEFLKDSVTTRTQYPNSNWNNVEPKKSKSMGKYKAVNNNRTREEYTEDIMFASDNEMKPGYGVVLEDDGTYLSYVGNVRPEQHRADRIANYWASSKRKIEANLLATGQSGAVGEISPRHLLELDGTDVYPISISHNWRDDTLQVVMLELGNYTPPQPGPTPPPSRLPAGYTELAYLETDGNAFIDTGIKGLDVDTVKGKVSIAALGTTIYVVGGRQTSSTSSKAMGYALYSSGHDGFTYYPQDWRTGVGESITAGQIVSFETFMGASSQTFSVNGVQLDSAFLTVNKGNSSGSRTLYLFGLHTGASTLQYSANGIRIYEMQMFYEGNKISDYVPAMRDSDSVVGMYDLVSNTFLTNAGGGTFSYGTL